MTNSKIPNEREIILTYELIKLQIGTISDLPPKLQEAVASFYYHVVRVVKDPEAIFFNNVYMQIENYADIVSMIEYLPKILESIRKVNNDSDKALYELLVDLLVDVLLYFLPKKILLAPRIIRKTYLLTAKKKLVVIPGLAKLILELEQKDIELEDLEEGLGENQVDNKESFKQVCKNEQEFVTPPPQINKIENTITWKDFSNINNRITELRENNASIQEIEKERDLFLSRISKENNPELYERVEFIFDELIYEMKWKNKTGIEATNKITNKEEHKKQEKYSNNHYTTPRIIEVTPRVIEKNEMIGELSWSDLKKENEKKGSTLKILLTSWFRKPGGFIIFIIVGAMLGIYLPFPKRDIFFQAKKMLEYGYFFTFMFSFIMWFIIPGFFYLVKSKMEYKRIKAFFAGIFTILFFIILTLYLGGLADRLIFNKSMSFYEYKDVKEIQDYTYPLKNELLLISKKWDETFSKLNDTSVSSYRNNIQICDELLKLNGERTSKFSEFRKKYMPYLQRYLPEKIQKYELFFSLVERHNYLIDKAFKKRKEYYQAMLEKKPYKETIKLANESDKTFEEVERLELAITKIQKELNELLRK
mgnify:CR=1 FL=1